MIRVLLSLQSARGRLHNRVLGIVLIANDGTGTAARGNYDVVARKGLKGFDRVSAVKDFPRKSQSALELLRRALNRLHEEGKL